jgi:hypothetical protein
MAKQDTVREHVDEILTSMDHMERLDAGPAFFSKLRARLNTEAIAPSRRPRLFPVWVPKLRPVFLALLILVNLVTVIFAIRAGASGEKSKKTSLGIVAEDYSLDQNLADLYSSSEETQK